jgi:hypothetical protein
MERVVVMGVEAERVMGMVVKVRVEKEMEVQEDSVVVVVGKLEEEAG